ncbi:TetR/AcrR family transcriptional regulator [Actinomadura keratinilytica]|uniref:TetR/AcrR family transcriptional regulator n=1 Tax=Actinomadura keratinilytica TaxID=547461 RepID=UPI0036213BC3
MTKPTSTRERIVAESLRLFADRGYAATSVAEIEAAAGLSPGAGGLYRHFRSKEEVLASAIREHIERTGKQVTEVLEHAKQYEDRPLEVRLRMTCQAGLAKMREEQDLIRVLFRDLDQFPHLVAEMREGIVNPSTTASRSGCRSSRSWPTPTRTGPRSPPCWAARSSTTGWPTSRCTSRRPASTRSASWRAGPGWAWAW